MAARNETHPTLWIRLTTEQIEWAIKVARGREECSDGYTPPDNGEDSLKGNLRGAMAEIAVCVAAGIPYREHVDVYANRPGASPDLVVKGYKVSVKSCKKWVTNPSLIVMEKDTENDLYVLVRVDENPGLCEILGYVTKKQLLTYEPEVWKWDATRPGAKKPKKKRRYVPMEDLTPFKGAK
jgi:hypothetical protein